MYAQRRYTRDEITGGRFEESHECLVFFRFFKETDQFFFVLTAYAANSQFYATHSVYLSIGGVGQAHREQPTTVIINFLTKTYSNKDGLTNS